MTIRTALALSENVWGALARWLDSEVETAGVLTARVIDDHDGLTILVRAVHPADEGSYLERRPDALRLRSTGWVPAVRQAGVDDEMALFVHTHPRGRAFFSARDEQVDEDLRRSFAKLAGVPLYGSIVIAGEREHPLVAARVWRDGRFEEVDIVRVVGDRLSVFPSAEGGLDGDMYDRQLRAFGRAGQSTLGQLRVGIVGAGGTGSPLFEQLVRLGVGQVVVVDDDVVTPSTIARGAGSTVSDVGVPKAVVLRALAEQIGLATRVDAVVGNIRDPDVLMRLRHCDVVFCCADGHSARLILNRWAYWHIAPVIDVAVLISSTDGMIQGIDGRLTWLAPGAACLLCRGRIDPTLAYAERLDPIERRSLAEQGYAPELEEPQPSVVSYTSLMASTACTELLNRLFGFAETAATEYLYRFHERAISANRRTARPQCFCADASTHGRGLDAPYLDLTWAV